MLRLPSSPSRKQALIEFEPVLLQNLQKLTGSANPEVKDAMHYALFSIEDRFCISSAWLIAPRLGISLERFSPAACAIETLLCSLNFKLRGYKAGAREKFLEPVLAEAATYGLIPLAFEMVLTAKDTLSTPERAEVATILSQVASPVHFLSALHREERFARDRFLHSLSLKELRELHEEKATPAYQAVGRVFELLAANTNTPVPPITPWFKKLGLLGYWISEFQSMTQLMSLPEAMDLIKSLEAELLEQAKALGIKVVAHEIIEPLADSLKTRLQ